MLVQKSTARIEKRKSIVVADEMMRQDAGRFRRVRLAFPAGAQMGRQALHCDGGADEATVAAPRDQVDVRIRLYDAAHRLARRAGTEARQAAELRAGQCADDVTGDSVPGGHQYG